MECVTQCLKLSKDLGLFLVYSCGYCTSVVFDIVVNWFPSIHSIGGRAILLFKASFLAPVRIILTVLIQLFLLPVNIPLRLLLGTSLTHILVYSNTWTDGYVITTILQYILVLTVFGISIGAICGTSLGVVDSIWSIPDIYIDIPVRFWRSLPSIWGQVPESPMFESQHGTEIRKNVDHSVLHEPLSPSAPPVMKSSSLSDMPVTPKYRYDPKRWSRPSSVSKESILKVASKLPSNFFQQCQFDGEMQHNLSPSQSSQTNTHNSSADFTSIWDKIEESPTTLRTEDGLGMLSKRKAFSSPSKNGTLTVK